MSMKKYNIGDKVKIKNIKVEDSSLYIFGINSDMERFACKVLTICNIYRTYGEPERDIYIMVEDNHRWHWSLSMFEPYFNEHFVQLSSLV